MAREESHGEDLVKKQPRGERVVRAGHQDAAGGRGAWQFRPVQTDRQRGAGRLPNSCRSSRLPVMAMFAGVDDIGFGRVSALTPQAPADSNPHQSCPPGLHCAPALLTSGFASYTSRHGAKVGGAQQGLPARYNDSMGLYPRLGGAHMKRWSSLAALAAIFALPASAQAALSINATPQNAAQAKVQAQNAPAPSAALVSQLLKTPENQLTNADRAELGAALIHGTVSISTTGAAPSSVAPALNTGTPAPSSKQSATPGAVGQCWGDRETTENLTIAGGANVVSGSVVVDGWCQGPGHQAIVSVAGWQYPHWSWGPYCVGNDTDYHGPDGSWVGSNSTWAHALHTFSGGVSYAFGCGYLRSGEDALRIAYNGYWDNYDDWGF
jgi:hypothetical protein